MEFLNLSIGRLNQYIICMDKKRSFLFVFDICYQRIYYENISFNLRLKKKHDIIILCYMGLKYNNFI